MIKKNKKLIEVLSIEEGKESDKDKNEDGVDDDLQILHDCDDPVKESEEESKPSKKSKKPWEKEDTKKESIDLDTGTGRFNKRIKEQCGCGIDMSMDVDPIDPSHDVVNPDVFVAPPTDEEKASIVWSFAGKVADYVEELIESDPDLKRVYGHEIPRKSEIMHALLFDFVSQNLDKA